MVPRRGILIPHSRWSRPNPQSRGRETLFHNLRMKRLGGARIYKPGCILQEQAQSGIIALLFDRVPKVPYRDVLGEDLTTLLFCAVTVQDCGYVSWLLEHGGELNRLFPTWYDEKTRVFLHQPRARRQIHSHSKCLPEVYSLESFAVYTKKLTSVPRYWFCLNSKRGLQTWYLLRVLSYKPIRPSYSGRKIDLKTQEAFGDKCAIRSPQPLSVT